MIRVSNLVKEFDGGNVRAVDDISFEVPAGALVTLLGPSGCGKTTTLRSIAGLERPRAGEIQIGDRVVFSSEKGVHLPSNRRRIGMVFQSYAIWPHMTVFDNVAYPLRNTRASSSEARERTMRSLSLVGLESMANRPAPNLSGGQQQRVALARALVAEPEVLLLDEPLSNLDAKLRENMRVELRELQQRLGITALYVTHDQVEALAISDVVAVMSKGKIVEFGDPRAIYESPRSRFAAEFIGLANVVPVTCTSADARTAQGTSPLGPIRFLAQQSVHEDTVVRPGQSAAVLIRPEDVTVERQAPSGEANVWRGRVVSAIFLGTHYDCVVQVQEVQLRAQVPRSLRLQGDEEVFVSVKPELCIPVVDDGAARADDPAAAAEESGVTVAASAQQRARQPV